MHPSNATCVEGEPHPSIFDFSGFETAKRHRLGRPRGNPLGLNPAGDLPFRMRANQGFYSLHPSNATCVEAHPSIFDFSGFETAKRHRLCRPRRNPLGLNPAKRHRLCRPRGNPLGLNSCWGSAVSHACKSRLLFGSIPATPHASRPIHPSLTLAGSKLLNWHRLCRPRGNPLGLNPAGDLPFRMRANQGFYSVHPSNATCVEAHPSSFVFISGFETAKRHRLCRPRGNPLGLNPAGDLPFRARANQGFYSVHPSNATCVEAHPSIFDFSGFETAKRHRLCRPRGNPLGLNPAGDLPFRMRANQGFYSLHPSNATCVEAHPSIFDFSGFETAKRHRLCRPRGNPLGLNPAGDLPFRMRANQGFYSLHPSNATCVEAHPSSFVSISGFETAKRHRLGRPRGNPLGLNPAGDLPFRMRANQGFYSVHPSNATCVEAHPSSFVFISGFETAKRHRLCRPRGNPLGLNPAGDLLFRMRANQGFYSVHPSNATCVEAHPSIFDFSGFETAKRHRLCRPRGNPLGLNPAGDLPFRMRANDVQPFAGNRTPRYIASSCPSIQLCFY